MLHLQDIIIVYEIMLLFWSSRYVALDVLPYLNSVKIHHFFIKFHCLEEKHVGIFTRDIFTSYIEAKICIS
jgi:hypothetical protein